MATAIRRPLSAALPAALLLLLSACNLDGGDVATGGSAASTASALRYAARAEASHPAWGDPGWSMQYAHNGQCDDPRYRTSNGGRARPGTDEHDCDLYGDGLK
ncbi:hypothetical protein [Azospirillum halopraeferens]|uniref:hypothetical protein n=1 Tax=Azospirillum halopraeferens TaxID=34010 RepID=UPI00040C7EA0|nr:hypothetical protein [Azospirillum halopraeferens]